MSNTNMTPDEWRTKAQALQGMGLSSDQIKTLLGPEPAPPATATPVANPLVEFLVRSGYSPEQIASVLRGAPSVTATSAPVPTAPIAPASPVTVTQATVAQGTKAPVPVRFQVVLSNGETKDLPYMGDLALGENGKGESALKVRGWGNVRIGPHDWNLQANATLIRGQEDGARVSDRAYMDKVAAYGTFPVKPRKA